MPKRCVVTVQGQREPAAFSPAHSMRNVSRDASSSRGRSPSTEPVSASGAGADPGGDPLAGDGAPVWCPPRRSRRRLVLYELLQPAEIRVQGVVMQDSAVGEQHVPEGPLQQAWRVT